MIFKVPSKPSYESVIVTSKAGFVSKVHLSNLCACVSLLRDSPFLPSLWCSDFTGQVASCTGEASPETKVLEIRQSNTFMIENSWQTMDSPLKTQQALLLLRCEENNRKEEAWCDVSW